jgi:hypothetical protein
MALNRDYRDLFAALNGTGAEYLVVGGYALAAHGAPRYTRDLDIWVRSSSDNAKRVWAALEEFGAPLGQLTLNDLESLGIVFQIGVAPSRIDVLTEIDGVTFEEAWPHRIAGDYGGQSIDLIGREEFLRNKKASGRLQDLADIEAVHRMAGDHHE